MRLYVVRNVNSVSHEKSKLCNALDVEPDEYLNSWFDSSDDDICAKCDWFANHRFKSHVGMFSVCLGSFDVTPKKQSDWWIGNHLSGEKKDYHYAQTPSVRYILMRHDLRAALSRMDEQGVPLRPSDVKLLELSRKLVGDIMGLLENERDGHLLLEKRVT